MNLQSEGSSGLDLKQRIIDILGSPRFQAAMDTYLVCCRGADVYPRLCSVVPVNPNRALLTKIEESYL